MSFDEKIAPEKTIPSNEVCARAMKVLVAKSIRMTRKTLQRMKHIFKTAPGGAAGVLGHMTSEQQVELKVIVGELESFYNTHKNPKSDEITVV